MLCLQIYVRYVPTGDIGGSEKITALRRTAMAVEGPSTAFVAENAAATEEVRFVADYVRTASRLSDAVPIAEKCRRAAPS